MKKELILFLLAFWLAVCSAISIFSIVINRTEENHYTKIFLWFFSPVIIIIGFIFVKTERKSLYFQMFKTRLLNKF